MLTVLLHYMLRKMKILKIPWNSETNVFASDINFLTYFCFDDVTDVY